MIQLKLNKVNFQVLILAKSSSYHTPQPEIYVERSLSPCEIVTSHPMNLEEGVYESTLLKGDILHYY